VQEYCIKTKITVGERSTQTIVKYFVSPWFPCLAFFHMPSQSRVSDKETGQITPATRIERTAYSIPFHSIGSEGDYVWEDVSINLVARNYTGTCEMHIFGRHHARRAVVVFSLSTLE
jgi:hypothetical protein